ncbi:hypothetical protein FHP25_25075 [Vineibacter terrae]|uniref:Uncharacterized protein n=1 Tax=Vineibacter terrae TaxID=2586908 RepID=A0A5C8PGC1_9HYPH|nr:hypothetical protein [Vineibacter terrae]TXL72572.1 hypothetical protein FHP25_25075 [Vineibacter terrae]
MIWLTQDERGRDMFNFTIRDSSGRTAFEMRDNDWVAHPKWEDIEIGAEGRSLYFKSKLGDISLRLRFAEKSIATIFSDFDYDPRRQLEMLQHLGPDLGPLNPLKELLESGLTAQTGLICTVEGRWTYPQQVEIAHGYGRYGGIQIMKSFAFMVNCVVQL